jgi:RND family efflux transporter MFP subunit
MSVIDHSGVDEASVEAAAEDETGARSPPADREPGRPRPRLAILIRAAVPLGLVAAGCLAYAILSIEPEQGQDPPVEEQAIRTRVTELRVRDYPVVIRTQGTVQPHNEVALSAQVSGRVTRVSPAFEVGSYFSAGEVLVELDARDFQTALTIAQARRLSAESALQLATQNYERKMQLYNKRNVSVSQAELDQASATRLQAEAERDSAVAQLEQARRDLERTRIRAPFDGRVRQKGVGLGQSVGVGTALGVVFAIDYAEVRLPIAGRELQFLELPERAGDEPVDVELRNAIRQDEETVWHGKIVRTEGAVDEDSLELFVIAQVDDPFGLKSSQPPLRIGQPVVASIEGKVLTDVVALPRAAVRQLDQVFLVDRHDRTLEPRTITPVWSDEEHVIVRDPAIRDGGWLATTRLVYAPSGAAVEIISDMELAAAGETSGADAEPVTN